MLITIRLPKFKSNSTGFSFDTNVLSVKDMGHYEIRNVEYVYCDGNTAKSVLYYTKDDAFIGDEKNAKYLVEELGIIPQRANRKDSVASIGYSPKDGKYYGWSHRAINGFAIGDTIKHGDCAYIEKDGEWTINNKREAKKAAIRFADSVSSSMENKADYEKWCSLINMTAKELQAFLLTKEGQEAGMTRKQAREQGIRSGHESAKWILKMKNIPYKDWTPNMHKWAKRQIGFVTRMLGNKGRYYNDDGTRTRLLTSLMLWGHDPRKTC